MLKSDLFYLVMILLILIVIFGLIFSYFATQNTEVVDIYFWKYHFQNIPLYMIILGSLGMGFLISAIAYIIRVLSSSMTISEKNDKLKDIQKELSEVTKRAHKLELENAKLKTKLDEEDYDEDSI